MRRELEEEIENDVNDWVWGLLDSLALSSTTAFAAGVFHAGGKLSSKISWANAKDMAIEYMETYRKNLSERGVLTVKNPVYQDGKIVKWVTEEIDWMKDMAATMKSEIMGIIEDGLHAGQPIGAGIGADGKYVAGSISRTLQDYTDRLKGRVSTIAETEVHRAYSNGMKDLYDKEGVQYVKWVCQSDACENCVPLNNQIFMMGEEPDLVHPNCHCECVPYEPSMSEIIHGV